ncbi:MAG: TonB-dependent receptor [Clostridium sp.]|nr:TonB-dependent receptor [Clostridium sp.]
MISRFLTVILWVGVAVCTAARPVGQLPSFRDEDSLKRLREVVVTTQSPRRSVIPVQQLAGEELKRLNAHSVADAMRYFSGVQVKDYGGVGGLKTVNVRSLGTNHTGVFYDGVELGNAQNGVVDLGRFSLDNMESVQLYNGQKTTIFQPAKDYASASAVYLQTRVPQFDGTKRDNLNLSVKGGSFGTFNPSLMWEHKLSAAVSSQLSAEWMTTNGRYKFRYAKKDGYDTTEVRHNGDVQALRVETGVFGRTERTEWRGKLYFYNSERGYPGAAVREEPGRFTHQDRQWDTSVFGQGSWRHRFTRRYSMMVNAKVAYDYLHYLSDPRLDVTTMYTDNSYRQTEGYLSVAHLVSVTEWLSLSLANDGQYNYLDADLVNFVYPTRYSLLSSLAANITWRRLSAQASVLHTFVSDHTREAGGAAGNNSRVTPTVAVAYRAGGGFDLRAFYKRIFRMPTLNDLYYTFIGNKSLNPEYTTQYDAGFTWTLTPRNGALRRVEMQTDGYYNEVEDKIVAMPTSNQFRWTMMNFGLCHIWGLDTSIKALWRVGAVDVQAHATYTYNKAMDHTDKGSRFYGGQLPYIPWHSASAILSASWRGWAANYSFIYTGERYEASANIPENYSKPWYTSDLSLSKDFRMRRCGMRITGEVNNLFNQQYEVVQCYPMPGTNFKLKWNVTL